MRFYIFGSENSQDYDVLVEVGEIPTDFTIAHKMCKDFNLEISKILPDKEINSNLIIIRNNEIVRCLKGTVDELTNCLYYTYSNHRQFFENPIEKPIKRDLIEKALRVARFIITFYSRTELRTEIKAALRGNILLKIEVLKKIDFIKMTEFTEKKEKPEDVYKTLAFQFGQVFSLIDGFETDSYTKNGIAKNYVSLSNLLNRGKIEISDLAALNFYLLFFIEWLETNISNTLRLEEVKK